MKCDKENILLSFNEGNNEKIFENVCKESKNNGIGSHLCLLKAKERQCVVKEQHRFSSQFPKSWILSALFHAVVSGRSCFLNTFLKNGSAFREIIERIFHVFCVFRFINLIFVRASLYFFENLPPFCGTLAFFSC